MKSQSWQKKYNVISSVVEKSKPLNETHAKVACVFIFTHKFSEILKKFSKILKKVYFY